MYGPLDKETTAVKSVQKECRFPLANFTPGAVNGDAGGSGLLRAVKYTVPQAAKAMGIGETKMREIIRNGEVPVIRISDKILVLDRDLESYLQGNYGALKPLATKPANGLPPLPKHVRESDLMRKAS